MKSAKILFVCCLTTGAFLIHSLIWLSYRDCAKPNSHVVSEIRGRVVGRDLWLAQYRWLRRMFKGNDAVLILYRVPTPLSTHRELVHEIAADAFGNFDFGPIEPGYYDLQVKLADSSFPAQHYAFTVERGRYSGPLTIDDSYEGSSTCKGRDVDFH